MHKNMGFLSSQFGGTVKYKQKIVFHGHGSQVYLICSHTNNIVTRATCKVGRV